MSSAPWGVPSKAILGAPDGHLHHKVLKLRLAAELGTVVPLMVNYFFERPARMVNRRTSLRESYGQQMINLQRLRNAEEGLKHDTEIRRGYITDVHGTEPQHLDRQQYLQDAVRQAAVIVCFPFIQLCAHGIGVVRAWIAEHEYMDRRMAEVHTGIHAATLAARCLLNFDLVAHLSLEDLHNLFPNLRVSYDKEFPGLRVSSRGSPSRGFQDLFYNFIWDWLVHHKSGANAAAPLKHLQKGVNRFGAVRNWKFTRFFRSHESCSSSSLYCSANARGSKRAPPLSAAAGIDAAAYNTSSPAGKLNFLIRIFCPQSHARRTVPGP